MAQKKLYVYWFADLCADDVAIVGGKNASLGEMIRALKDEGILVPDGFATTADAFHEFLEANGLTGNIRTALKDLQRGFKPLDQVGRAIRRLFERTHFPEAIAEVQALGLPAPAVVTVCVILIQVVGSVLLFLHRTGWLGAALLVVFTLSATVLGHSFWRESGAVYVRELTTFLEHLGIIGGLMLAGIGTRGPVVTVAGE